ncbi:MAG: WD40 repeat domain-containing protein [Armatimonadota bacterium]
MNSGSIKLLRWSNDAKGIYCIQKYDSEKALVSYPVTGARPSILGHCPRTEIGSIGLMVLPDGDETLYVDSSGRVFIADLSCNGKRQITTIPKATNLVGAELSPNGRYLAAGFLDADTPGKSAVMVFDLKTDRRAKIEVSTGERHIPNIEFLGWHPDGERFIARYVISRNHRELREYNAKELTKFR